VNNDLQRAAAANADAVLHRFFTSEGRLNTLPAKQSRQLAVYDLIVQRFVPGVRYTELEVNRELMAVYDDYVTLRRGLIDFGLMDRSGGLYWRSGGTVPVEPVTGVSMSEAVEPVAPSLPAPASQRAAPAASARGAARREAILTAAAQLFAERGYAAVGMDDIGAAAGVTGPAIYRHFGAKATVLTAVFDRVIDAVAIDPDLIDQPPADDDTDPAAELRHLVQAYAAAVSSRRRLMAVFIREVHHLPPEDGELLVERQRVLVRRWRTLLAQAQPEWDAERVRTAVHGAFGMLNAVGTFASPLTDRELAAQLSDLALAALRLPAPR
jgi:AcrR family transcriptional regulator